MKHRSILLLALVSLVATCTVERGVLEDPFAGIEDRAPGVRAPMSATCDDVDPTRCLLPWPSNRFTVSDPDSPTGLRVKVESDAMARPDDVSWLNLSDGFSTITAITTGFATALAPIAAGDDHLVLLAAPTGERVPLRLELVTESVRLEEGEVESLLIGYPLRSLAPNSDYLGVVRSSLVDTDGNPPVRERATELALGLVEPETRDEMRLGAYHAPSRTLLATAGIEASEVTRLWDFTTRSADDATHYLNAMRDRAMVAVRAGGTSVLIDSATVPGDPAIAVVVEGLLLGLPSFRDEEGNLRLDADGDPYPEGTSEAPFRVLVPAGTGDYRVVLYGHGTGGSFRDTAFDHELGEAGLAKVATDFYGWSGNDVIMTFVNLNYVLAGSITSTSGLLQALADLAALQASLDGDLADALAGPELAGVPNPAAGRRPDVSNPIWTGGSLGGTMGMTYAASEPAIDYAVLNVPGAAWTHWMRQSFIYEPLSVVMVDAYPNRVDEAHVLVMAQGYWDPIDGAAWTAALEASPVICLIQESMGDPVMPNAGTDAVAAALEAVQIGVVLEPIEGVAPVATAVARSAITQYRVEDTGIYEVHGFAAENTPAGFAARAQISAFLDSVLVGTPEITVPEGCTTGTADGSCDFTEP